MLQFLILRRANYDAAKQVFIASGVSDAQRPNFYSQSWQSTMRHESAMMRGMDSVLLLQEAIRAMESKLKVTEWWTPESDEWKAADTSLAEREYQRAISRLEGVAVARLFELEKANQAATGELAFVPWNSY